MRSIQRLLIGVVLSILAAGPLCAQLASQARARPAAPAKMVGKTRADLPQTYGTSVVTYLSVPASSFLPWDSSKSFTSFDFGFGQRWGNVESLDFVAPIQLPAGALIVYLELDGNDSNPNARVLGSLAECAYDATNCSYYPTVGASNGGDCSNPGFICSGEAYAGGSGGLISVDLSSEGIVVDNFLNQYTLLAETADAFDGSVAIGGMIVGYVLQVSPAPLTATFPDVPTSDFGFQFVEALVASGITGGCGGGLYCPDAPVTRRQMAIFIAKALGLQF